MIVDSSSYEKRKKVSSACWPYMYQERALPNILGMITLVVLINFKIEYDH